MTSLCDFLGSEVLSETLRASIERNLAATDDENQTDLLPEDAKEDMVNGISGPPLSPSSESNVSVSGGHFPDNATTRDIIRKIQEVDLPSNAYSSWTLPIKFRPFKASRTRSSCQILASGKSIAANLPFRLRLDSLFYRCRLLVLDESVHMLETIQKMDNRTQHSKLLVDGLRALSTSQAGEVIKDIGKAITECRSKSLKRLEVEFRLMQIALHRILRSLNTTSDLNVQGSIQVAIQLCQEYPDTAGIFLSDCLSVKSAIEQGRIDWKIDLYKKEANEFWKRWANYEVGTLSHCNFGHPYSAGTFRDCPECGRAESPISLKFVDYSQFLDETAFLAKMQDKKSAASPTDTEEAFSLAKENDMATSAPPIENAAQSFHDSKPASAANQNPNPSFNGSAVATAEVPGQAEFSAAAEAVSNPLQSIEPTTSSQEKDAVPPMTANGGVSPKPEEMSPKSSKEIEMTAWGAFFALKSRRII